MSSNPQIPPMVQEQLAQFQQTQQNFQSILMQKQQLESQKLETEKALEELKRQVMTKQFSNTLELL